MCGRTLGGNPGNPEKNLTRCAPSPEIPEIRGEKLQNAPHPRKSRKKLTRYASSPEIPEKPSQNAPRPRKSRKTRHENAPYPGKKPHKMRPIPGKFQRRFCCWLVVGCCCLLRQAVQKPPAGAMKDGLRDFFSKNIIYCT